MLRRFPRGCLRHDFDTARAISLKRTFVAWAFKSKVRLGRPKFGRREQRAELALVPSAPMFAVDVSGARSWDRSDPQEQESPFAGQRRERQEQWDGSRGVRTRTGPPRATPIVRAALPILRCRNCWRHFLAALAWRTVALPTLVSALDAASSHHGVDGASAADDTTERHIEAAVVQLRGWRDR